MARYTQGAESPSTAQRVVIVDDDVRNVELLRRLLDAEPLALSATTDPVQALAWCAEQPPDLLLLDLHMPALDGFAVLARLRARRMGDGHFPVLVLTGDDTTDARRSALAAGADDFLGKPFDPIEVRLRVEHLLEAQALRRMLSGEKRLLEHLVAEQVQEIEHTKREVLDRLALASEFRDDDTHQHARRIGRSAELLAGRLSADATWAALLGRAAPLHDIGKLAVSDAILRKPGPLSADEHALMRRHTTIGAQILAHSRSEVLQLAEVVALGHHERWDGSGYPEGRAAEETPLAARIVAVSDVFDALAHERPYKIAWRPNEARAWIVERGGTLFDPEVVAAFEQVDDDALLAPTP